MREEMPELCCSSGTCALAIRVLVSLMAAGTQDQRFADRVVIQVQTGFFVTRLAAVATDVTWEPNVHEKDRVVVQEGLHRQS
jgi:hypothetical protein